MRIHIHPRKYTPLLDVSSKIVLGRHEETRSSADILYSQIVACRVVRRLANFSHGTAGAEMFTYVVCPVQSLRLALPLHSTYTLPLLPSLSA